MTHETTDYDEMALLFKALAHPMRLQILDMLRLGEVCVCHMETAFAKRQAYISQQLMVLREMGLVEARKDGLQVFYRLVNPRLAPLLDTALGPSTGTDPGRLENCPCPRCTVSIPEPGK